MLIICVRRMGQPLRRLADPTPEARLRAPRSPRLHQRRGQHRLYNLAHRQRPLRRTLYFTPLRAWQEMGVGECNPQTISPGLLPMGPHRLYRRARFR